MATNTISITVNVQTNAANVNINALNVNIKSIGTTTAAASNQAVTGLNAVSQAITQATRAASQLTSALAGMAVLHVGAAMIEAADAINRVQIALRTMTGSANLAQETLDQIRHLAKEQPFAFTELLETTQRLKAFGFEAQKVPAMVETISNAAAALGKGKAGVDSITLALGQMREKGIVQGQELFRQLAEQGVQAGKYLKTAVEKELGKPLNMTEFRRMIEKGVIAAEPAIAIILAGMKKDLGNVGAELTQLVSVRFTKLADDLRDLGRIIAADLAPALIKILDLLQGFIGWLERMPPAARYAAEAVIALATAIWALNAAASALKILNIVGMMTQFAGVLQTVGIAAQLAFQARSITAFFSLLAQSLTMATTAAAPFLVVLGQIAAVIATIYASIKIGQTLRDLIPADSALGSAMGLKEEREALQAQAELRQKNLVLAQKLREELAKTDASYKKAPPIAYGQMSEGDLTAEITRLAAALNQVRDDQQKKNQSLIITNTELLKHQMEIAQQALDRAMARAEGQIFGLTYKYAGLFEQVKGNAAATAIVMKAINVDLAHQQEELAKKNRDAVEKQLDQVHKDFETEIKYWAKLYEEHLKYQRESLEIGYRAAISKGEFEQTIAESVRDQRIAELDAPKRQTLSQEIAYQQQVMQIRTDTAEKVLQIQLDMQDKAYNHELQNVQAMEEVKLAAAKTDLERQQISQDARDREAALLEESGEKMRQLIINNEFEISRIRLEANKATNSAIIEEQKKIYDKLKDSLSRVFDALLSKSTSVWEAMGNALKTAILGAIKEIVTSRAAAALMQLFGYGTVGFGGGPRGLGGQQPTFGGGGAGGGGSIFAGLLGIGGGGGGGYGGFITPPTFGDTPGSESLGRAAADSRAASPVGSMAGLGAGLKGILGQGNAAAFGGGAGGATAAALSSPAAGIGGALLAMSGWQRGGAAGLGMMVAGGFLTGASIGALIAGPFGAAIGAFVGTVVGAVAGTIRLFIKSADDKLREKIKRIYGIDVADKGVRAQILQLAQQKYGGNLDMAVRSLEVQQLVQLYAMATGTTATGMPRPMYGATFAQSGGALSLQSVYSNGQAVNSPYSGVTTTQWMQQGLYVQLNPQQANDLFEGRVVSVIGNNPDSVAAASATGTRAGSSRDAQRSSLMEPLTVVR